MNIVAGRNVVTKVCFTFMKYFPDNSGERIKAPLIISIVAVCYPRKWYR
jgi:hypothetical protein